MCNKVILFMGSHRSTSNTGFFIEKISEKLNTYEIPNQIIDINKLKISHCIDCDYCKGTWGKCVFEDDMTEVYDALKTATVVIFASPVYFNGLTAKMKAMVDRLQMVFICDFVHKKPFVESTDSAVKKGYLVSIGGAKSYTNQFVGNRLSIELVFRNLRIPFVKHLTYHSTDHQLLCDREDVETDINVVAKEIYEEVMKVEK